MFGTITYSYMIKRTVSLFSDTSRSRWSTLLWIKFYLDEPRASCSQSRCQWCQRPRAGSANFYLINFCLKTKDVLSVCLQLLNYSQVEQRAEARVFPVVIEFSCYCTNCHHKAKDEAAGRFAVIFTLVIMHKLEHIYSWSLKMQIKWGVGESNPHLP